MVTMFRWSKLYEQFILEEDAIFADYGGSWIPSSDAVLVWDPVDHEWCYTTIKIYKYLYKCGRLF